MLSLTLEKLISMDKKDLSKLKKDEIISSIKNYGYQLSSAKSAADQAAKKLIEAKQEQDSIKEMLAGFAGVDLEREEYSGSPQTKLSLSEITGKAIAKFHSK